MLTALTVKCFVTGRDAAQLGRYQFGSVNLQDRGRKLLGNMGNCSQMDKAYHPRRPWHDSGG